MRVQNRSIQVDNQVVEYQGNHGKHRLSSPKVVHIKALKAVAIFEILYYILIIGTGAVGSPDLIWRCLCVIGDHDTESVLTPVDEIFKEARLRAQGCGTMGDCLAHHHVSPGLCPLPVTVLKDKLTYLNALCCGVPLFYLEDFSLNRRGDRHGNDIGEAL